MNIIVKQGLVMMMVIPMTIFATEIVITNDNDFDLGTLQSLNHNVPNNDQLQISTTQSTFPVLWIANAGEDTVSKIDTDNDCEVARYETWFSSGNHSAFGGPAPSRTAVDGSGNVFVANRHFDNKPVAVLKILLEGGIDRNGNGVIDTSQDTNNDCIIQPSEMISLVDTNNNGVLDDAELADERVAFIEQIPNTTGSLGRSLCIAPDGDVWAGTFQGTRAYYELSPLDGTVKSGPISTNNSPNYGCVIDSDGILFGASLSSAMPIIDTNTSTLLDVLNHGGRDYGIAGGNGKIYKGSARSPYLIYDPNDGVGEPDGNPATGTFTSFGGFGTSLGIGVDGNGDIVQGNSTIRKFNGTTDANIWQTANPSGNSNTRGILADSANNIWAVNFNANNVTKFRGTDGQFLNTVPVGTSPYTYSDATGIGFQIQNPSGTFLRTLDGGDLATPWDSISWNTEPEGSEPAGTSIVIEARASDTLVGLASETYMAVSNGIAGLGKMGKFIQIKAVLTPNGNGVSPILSDIKVNTLMAAASCDNDGSGEIDRIDIGNIMASRNMSVPPADPILDVDNNGIVNVLDARVCTLQCTNARCAVSP